MTADQAATREELADIIRAAMEAVKFGELDIQIQDVTEKGEADLGLKQKSAAVKQAG